MIWQNVPVQPHIYWSSAAAGDPVAAPSGMDKREMLVWESADAIGFDVGSVKPLIGDAVAVKDHSIMILKIKVACCARRRRAGCNRKQNDSGEQTGIVRR